jgi:hypothetical protein
MISLAAELHTVINKRIASRDCVSQGDNNESQSISKDNLQGLQNNQTPRRYSRYLQLKP